MTFDAAQRAAAEHDLPSFLAWRGMLERRYTVMPPWYWNESLCRNGYADYIRIACRPPKRPAPTTEGGHPPAGAA